MSIRNLTIQVQQEKAEHQRVQQFQSARSIQEPKAPQEAPKQTPFMLGASNRKGGSETAPTELPIQKQTVSPKIGLKERDKETLYGVPGGIVARFGRNALKEPIAPQEPEEFIPTQLRSESVLDTPLEAADESNEEETAQPQELEQAAEEEDEAARITIELQSH